MEQELLRRQGLVLPALGPDLTLENVPVRRCLLAGTLRLVFVLHTRGLRVSPHCGEPGTEVLSPEEFLQPEVLSAP